MNKFKKYLKEEGEGSCGGESGDIANIDTKLGKPLKRKKTEKEDSEEIKEAVDFNADGKIDINDLIFMTQKLSNNALREIIDLVSSYLIKRYQEPSDALPSDGVLRTYAYEGVIRKIQGNKIILKSSIPGYKITSNGMEVKMSDSELKQRVLMAIAASKRRNTRNRKVEVEIEDDLDDTNNFDVQDEIENEILDTDMDDKI